MLGEQQIATIGIHHYVTMGEEPHIIIMSEMHSNPVIIAYQISLNTWLVSPFRAGMYCVWLRLGSINDMRF